MNGSYKYLALAIILICANAPADIFDKVREEIKDVIPRELSSPEAREKAIEKVVPKEIIDEEARRDFIDKAIPKEIKGEPLDPSRVKQPDQNDPFIIPIEEQPRIERLIRESNFLPASFLQVGASRQRAVGLITGPILGTGFLVGKSLLLTNNHVIPTAESSSQLSVVFDYALDIYGRPPRNIKIYRFQPGRVFYTNVQLDFTLIALDTVEETDEPGDAASAVESREAGDHFGVVRLDKTGKVSPVSADTPQFVNIVQHPRGDYKQVALQENRIDAVLDPVIRYTTDTEPGSSGSPVFNNSWELIALHHSAGERSSDHSWKNNEGIRIDRIVDNLVSHFSSRPEGKAVLKELQLQYHQPTTE